MALAGIAIVPISAVTLLGLTHTREFAREALSPTGEIRPITIEQILPSASDHDQKYTSIHLLLPKSLRTYELDGGTRSFDLDDLDFYLYLEIGLCLDSKKNPVLLGKGKIGERSIEVINCNDSKIEAMTLLYRFLPWRL